MKVKQTWARHYEITGWVAGEAQRVFAHLDDHTRLSSHMSGNMSTVGSNRRGVLGLFCCFCQQPLRENSKRDRVLTELQDPVQMESSELSALSGWSPVSARARIESTRRSSQQRCETELWAGASLRHEFALQALSESRSRRE